MTRELDRAMTFLDCFCGSESERGLRPSVNTQMIMTLLEELLGVWHDTWAKNTIESTKTESERPRNLL